MKCYLGLGSNLGDRKTNLEKALIQIKSLSPKHSIKVSPVYETPAMLPNNAEASWNRPFFNLVVEIECQLIPEQLLEAVKKIEKDVGRQTRARWAPREIDIDLLMYGDTVFHSETLDLPHPGIQTRSFVLDPLKDLLPTLRTLNQAKALKTHSPMWAAILNLTPDSFSDGGVFATEENLKKYLETIDKNPIGMIDIGAESTRPGATEVLASEEWTRLKPALDLIQSFYREKLIKPLISVDTRNFETAKKAINCGIDFLNDVSGLADVRFLELLKNSNCQYVLMHSLSVPADPKTTLPANIETVLEVKTWFSKKCEQILKAGISLERIVLDPGVGFGKTKLQSLKLVQGLPSLFDLGCRILVGHSRKSFLTDFTNDAPQDRDVESIGASLALIESGVDILRVHNPEMHIRAFRGFSHARNNLRSIQ